VYDFVSLHYLSHQAFKAALGVLTVFWSYFQLCGAVPDESEVDSNLPLPAKRQECFDDSDIVPVQKTVDTKEISGSISARTLENIKKFSAFCDINERLECVGISRTKVIESRKRKKEINLFGAWDSKQDSAVLSEKGEGSTLSPRYSEIT
jgi:hypothetical protein